MASIFLGLGLRAKVSAAPSEEVARRQGGDVLQDVGQLLRVLWSGFIRHQSKSHPLGNTRAGLLWENNLGGKNP